jgi:hypothetical protein
VCIFYTQVAREVRALPPQLFSHTEGTMHQYTTWNRERPAELEWRIQAAEEMRLAGQFDIKH